MTSSIVTSAAKQLGGLVVKEAKYLYEVSDKIERLQRDLQWMHCFLQDADNKQNRDKMVAMWVAEVRDFAYEAEEIIERYVHEVSNPRKNGGLLDTALWSLCALCDAKALRGIGVRIDELRNRIAELIPRLRMYGIRIKDEPSLAKRLGSRNNFPRVEEDPVGLELHIARVVGELLLTDNDVRFVSISGMGGLGKTTLAMKVFQDAAIRGKRFKIRVWVSVSKEYELSVVLREILTGLSAANGSLKTDGLLTDKQLFDKINKLLNENACFLVLDDVWAKKDWHALAPAFESIGSKNSKILITTRKQDLMRDINLLGYFHDLNLLNEEHSWELLQRGAFPETPEIDYDMEKKKTLGKEMVMHCKGLPIAIITLGGVLRSKKKFSEWKAVKKCITSYLMGPTEQGNDPPGLSFILELSYNDLPFYLKPCFMYLGNFPEDFEIRVGRLYHLWQAEELVTVSAVDGDESYQQQEECFDEIAESYLNELVNRCMVQVGKRWADGRIRTCRLHDVMRDMCLSKCREVNFLSIVNHGSSSSKKKSSASVNRNMRRCTVYLRETKSDNPPFDPSSNIAPCIRSLLVFPYRHGIAPHEFHSPDLSKFFPLLRVFDIKHTHISMHPKSFGSFIHLRYLSFRRAKLSPSLAPQIWDCKYLETLDLRWLNDGIVVSNKFCKLERLRHLYLPHDMKLKRSKWLTFSEYYIHQTETLKFTDDQLQQMETLKNFSVKVFEISDLQKMTSMRVFTLIRLTYLSKEEVENLLDSPMIETERLVKPLQLKIKADVLNEHSSLLTKIQSNISIGGFDIGGKIMAAANLETFDTEFLTKLNLKDCELDEQGISVLEKLSHLRRITLIGKVSVSNKMSFSSGGFAHLNRLTLRELSELEEWEIGEGALPSLKSLVIERCNKLKEIPHGLPDSVNVSCKDPCVSGVEKYNICPYSAQSPGENPSESSICSVGKRLLSTCFP